MIGTFDGRVIRKNVAATGAAYAAAAFAGLLAQAVLARTVGRGEYGVYIAAFSLVTMLRFVHSVAGPEYLVREGARAPDRLHALVAGGLRVTALVAVALLAFTLVGARALGFPAIGVAVGALLAVRASLTAGFGTVQAGFRVVERLEVSSALSFGISVVSAAAMIAAVAFGAGIVGAAGAAALVSAAGIPAAVALLTRVTGRALPRPGRPAEFVRKSLPFAAVTTLLFGQNYADALIIRGLLGNEETGVYGAAYRIFVVLGWLPLAFTTSSYRTIAALAAEDRDRLRSFVERSSAGLVAAALPLAVGGAILARPIMRATFGADFAGGATALAILSGTLVAAFPAVLLIGTVVVGERPRPATTLLVGTFTANVALNLVLVPRHGIEAAAWTTAGTQLAIAAGATAILARRGMRVRWLRPAAPAVVAVLAMAAVVAPLHELALPVPVAAGAAVYAIAAFVLGVPHALGVRFPAWAQRLPARRSS